VCGRTKSHFVSTVTGFPWLRVVRHTRVTMVTGFMVTSQPRLKVLPQTPVCQQRHKIMNIINSSVIINPEINYDTDRRVSRECCEPSYDELISTYSPVILLSGTVKQVKFSRSRPEQALGEPAG
jgi:hypothetical protein